MMSAVLFNPEEAARRIVRHATNEAPWMEVYPAANVRESYQLREAEVLALAEHVLKLEQDVGAMACFMLEMPAVEELEAADQTITAKWLDTLTLPDDEQDVDGEIIDASIEDNYVGKEWHGRFGDTFLVIVETADGCRAIVSQGANCMKFDYSRREQLLSMIDALAQSCRVK